MLKAGMATEDNNSSMLNQTPMERALIGSHFELLDSISSLSRLPLTPAVLSTVRNCVKTITDGFTTLIAQSKLATASEALAGLDKHIARVIPEMPLEVQKLLQDLVKELRTIVAPQTPTCDTTEGVRMSAIQSAGKAAEPTDPIAGFCDNLMSLNNGAHVQIAEYMAKLSVAQRARFIERCNSMAASVAETLASEG